MFALIYLLLAFFLVFGIYVALKREANLHTLLQGTAYICILIEYILLVSYIITLYKNSNLAYISAFLFAVLFIIFILIFKSDIAGSIRIIEYYLHRRKVLEQGYEDIATIIDIKRIRVGRHGSKKYYLIVDYNGEKIKSLYFFDDIFSIGQDIKIMVYKNYKYVILNKK